MHTVRLQIQNVLTELPLGDRIRTVPQVEEGFERLRHFQRVIDQFAAAHGVAVE